MGRELALIPRAVLLKEEERVLSPWAAWAKPACAKADSDSAEPFASAALGSRLARGKAGSRKKRSDVKRRDRFMEPSMEGLQIVVKGLGG
jgi:hypothetical protein